MDVIHYIIQEITFYAYHYTGILHTSSKFEVNLSFFRREIVGRKHPTRHVSGLPPSVIKTSVSAAINLGKYIILYTFIWLSACT